MFRQNYKLYMALTRPLLINRDKARLFDCPGHYGLVRQDNGPGGQFLYSQSNSWVDCCYKVFDIFHKYCKISLLQLDSVKYVFMTIKQNVRYEAAQLHDNTKTVKVLKYGSSCICLYTFCQKEHLDMCL